jgi:hypothetical protein
MTYVKLALLLVQLATAVIQYVQRRQLISEGERRQIAREMANAARLTGIAKEVREEIGKLTHAEVDDALRDDFRD